MEEWYKKELLFQGTQKFSSYIKDELQINNKSMLDDFTSHATVAGATFFNKCWSTAVLFSKLLEREYQFNDPSFIRILPHPLFLLVGHTPSTDEYILANKLSLIVPKNEYESLYDELNAKHGSYNIPKYNIARLYLSILLDLLRWFTINNQTTLLSYDIINDAVTLRVNCLRTGKCSNFLELLNMNLDLENQLSIIVGNCSYNTFKNRGKYLDMDDFMHTTFFSQTTTHSGSCRYDEHQLVTNDDSPVESDSNYKDAEFSISEDVVHTSVSVENDNDALVEQLGLNVETIEPACDDESVVNVEHNDLGNETEIPSPDDDDEEGNKTELETESECSSDDDVEESNNVVGNSTDLDHQILDKGTKTDVEVEESNDVVGTCSELDNQILDDGIEDTLKIVNNSFMVPNPKTNRSILLLGMSTVDVQESASIKGTSNNLHELSTTTAKQCVAENIISTTDGRDLARINCIRIYAKTNVYTVSLVNTNPTKDLSSNPTVYDSNRHLNADYNCRNFVPSLQEKFRVGNDHVQFEEIALDYFYMPSGYSEINKFISITIPSIARNNILTMGGVIFLPFQISFFSQIVANYKILKENYSISFVGCTKNNTLWSCTQRISVTDMLQVFEKKICQEKQYCSVTKQEIKECDLTNVCRNDLLHIYSRIANPKDTRFIQLKYAEVGDSHLGYRDLLEEKSQPNVRNTHKRKSKLKRPHVQNKRQCFIPTTILKNLEQYVDKKWPTGNDKKEDFCQGMRRVLDITSDSQGKIVPFIPCREETISDDIISILEIVQQKFPSRLEKVKKALIDIDL